MSSYTSKVVPGNKAIPITPSDSVLVSGPCRSLWIGSSGNINVTFSDGTDVDNMPAHAGIFPFEVIKVRSGATEPAATNIWAIY